MKKAKLVEMILTLYNNVDEADQFSYYIPEIIRHCDSKYLLDLLSELAACVKDNMEARPGLLVDDKSSLLELIHKVDDILKSQKDD